jgi:hypothetical protein
MMSSLNGLRLQAFCCILSLALAGPEYQQLAALTAFAIAVQLTFIWFTKQLPTLGIGFLVSLWPILKYRPPVSIQPDGQSFRQMGHILFWKWRVLSLYTLERGIVHELRWWDGVIFYHIAILPEFSGIWAWLCVLAIGVAISFLHLRARETEVGSNDSEDAENENPGDDVLFSQKRTHS